jgi:exopolyphosphatase/guanosine-5'-triphosphate,3'-diphosphate pyrophosphatase
MNKIAIIDLGTNSNKLSIFDVSSEIPKLLLKEKQPARLGKGIQESGMISDEALEKTLLVLNDFKKVVKEYNIENAEIFSTEVMRQAKNSQEILDKIFQKTGFEVKTLMQEDEARIFWRGATFDFEWKNKIAAIDIGGGSVQFMWGTKDELEGYKLLKTGSLTLRDKFVKEEPPKDSDYEKIEAFIKKEITDLKNLGNSTPLIHGSTSVLDFYNEANMPMENFHFSRTHSRKTNLRNTKDFYLKTRTFNKEARSKFFPSYPDFMDGVYVGLANVLLIAQKTGITYELPSNNSIINGLIFLIREGKLDEFLNHK